MITNKTVSTFGEKSFPGQPCCTQCVLEANRSTSCTPSTCILASHAWTWHSPRFFIPLVTRGRRPEQPALMTSPRGACCSLPARFSATDPFLTYHWTTNPKMTSRTPRACLAVWRSPCHCQPGYSLAFAAQEKSVIVSPCSPKVVQCCKPGSPLFTLLVAPSSSA